MRSDTFLVWTCDRYPSYPFDEGHELGQALRRLFVLWELDPENPFGQWLPPGGRAVIKPNWVHDTNPEEAGIDALVTHASLIAYVMAFAARALGNSGEICVGDAPLQSADFANLLHLSRIAEVVEQCRSRHPGIRFSVEDWRLTTFDPAARRPGNAPSASAAADPGSYRLIDLGTSSFLEDLASRSDDFRVTCYPPRLMQEHHRPGTHEYLVSKRVVEADLVVNLPKMKTHIKAGLTGALKNLVGINGHKEYLPHHVRGAFAEGGDCYMRGNRMRKWYDAAYDRYWERYAQLPAMRRRLESFMLSSLWRGSRLLGGDSISAGSWMGNETVWRMTLDLNSLAYAGPSAAKKIITIVDGIVAGEGEGPLRPRARRLGLLAGGENPAYVDAVLSRLMGYNPTRIPTVYNAIYHRKSPFAERYLNGYGVRQWQNGSTQVVPFDSLPNLVFRKPRHWVGAQLNGARQRP